MLSIAYAASIGSVATIIGTPPNGIMAGYLAQQGASIGFGQWMLLGLPIAAVLLVVALGPVHPDPVPHRTHRASRGSGAHPVRTR